MVQNYLRALYEQLHQLNKQERLDILRDFEEYFEHGQMDGKTIDEMIQALGSPEEIAKDLLAAYSEEERSSSVALNTPTSSPFHKVNVEVNGVNLTIAATDDEKPTIEIQDLHHLTEATMENKHDTLRVHVRTKEKLRRFFLNIVSGNFRSSSAVLYLPRDQYEKLHVTNHSGAIQLQDVSAKEIILQGDNGRIITNAIQGEKLHASTDNGRIELTDNSFHSIQAQTDNGRIVFENCSSETTKAITNNGRVELGNVTGQVQARSKNGRIEAAIEGTPFPMNLRTDNGSIRLLAEQQLENIEILTETRNGSTTIFGEQTAFYLHGTRDITIQLKTKNGRITVGEF